MSNNHVLTVRLPAELKTKITHLAKEQGISANQFAMYLLAKGVVSVEYEQLLTRFRQGRTDEEILRDFDKVMDKIPERDDIPDWDKMPED